MPFPDWFVEYGGVLAVLMTVACFAWILPKLFATGSTQMLLASSIVAPWAFIWGWRHAGRIRGVPVVGVWLLVASPGFWTVRGLIVEAIAIVWVLSSATAMVGTFLWVVSRMFRSAGGWVALLGLVLPPYAFYWGWANMRRLHLTAVMTTWTVLAVVASSVAVAASLRSSADQVAFVDWARVSAIPIMSTDVTAAPDDLTDLTRRLSHARVIGLGEGTHGTHEFSALKTRLIQGLASQGLTDILLEESLPNMIAVDEYVQGGPGEAEAIVNKMGYWIHETEEMVALLQWVRAWNANAADRQRIHMRGMDLYNPLPGMDCVRTFAERWKVTIPTPDEASAPLLYTPYLKAWRAYATASREGIDRATAGLDAAAEVMDAQREEISRRAGTDAFDLARQCLENARQAHAYASREGFEASQLRGWLMGANVLWWLDRLGPSARAVIWAHNSHIRADTDMGGVLRSELGTAYAAVGLLFGSGEFQAKPRPDANDAYAERNGPPRAYRVPAPESSLVEGTLLRVPHPLFALDLRSLPEQAPGRRYAAGRRHTRFVGAWFEDGAPPSRALPGSLLGAYDTLVFVAETTGVVYTATARASFAPASK